MSTFTELFRWGLAADESAANTARLLLMPAQTAVLKVRSGTSGLGAVCLPSRLQSVTVSNGLRLLKRGATSLASRNVTRFSNDSATVIRRWEKNIWREKSSRSLFLLNI